jgi:hypothetical protein
MVTIGTVEKSVLMFDTTPSNSGKRNTSVVFQILAFVRSGYLVLYV